MITLVPNENALTVEMIRMFLRDRPEYNILLDDVEFKTIDIENAARLTVFKWNAYVPVSNITSIVDINPYLALLSICSILLRSEGLRQLRNQVNAQDGGIAPVGLDEKETLYMRWAESLGAEFDTQTKQIKIQQNLEVLMDNPAYTRSGYAYLNRWRR